jgi:hypothetical protein
MEEGRSCSGWDMQPWFLAALLAASPSPPAFPPCILRAEGKTVGK